LSPTGVDSSKAQYAAKTSESNFSVLGFILGNPGVLDLISELDGGVIDALRSQAPSMSELLTLSLSSEYRTWAALPTCCGSGLMFSSSLLVRNEDGLPGANLFPTSLARCRAFPIVLNMLNHANEEYAPDGPTPESFCPYPK
jgi:hypothetical protein